MIEDDETRRERLAERQYRDRRDRYVQTYVGATDEDMELLRETGLLDKTDVNLLTVGVVKQGFDLFGGNGVAKRITEAERVVEDVDELTKAGRKIFKLFR